jgi:hypothetical protein
MARRSRKSFEGWRRKYRHDLRHMHRCVVFGRLPDPDGSRRNYLEAVLSSSKLPAPAEVSDELELLNAEREANRLWSIPPVDMTKAELAEQKKRKDRERKERARRKARAETREAYLARVKGRNEPWKALGMSKATWYRRKAKTEAVRQGSSGPLPQLRQGCSAPIYTNTGTTLSHPHPIPASKGLQVNPETGSFTDLHRQRLLVWAVTTSLTQPTTKGREAA